MGLAGRQVSGARRRGGRQNGAHAGLDGVIDWLARAQPAADPDRARELLARTDRLAVLGTLAAGIAHEIRNPLVSVRTFIELLPERLDDEEFRTAFRQLALAEVERICDLLSDLLAFTRPAAPARAPSDAAALAAQTVRLLEPEARKRGVALQLDCAAGVAPVLMDESRVRQVLINLVLNGIEACDPNGGGRVDVGATPGGARTVVAVGDTGAGIPPDVLPHVFDPFVTTKDRGSGLGLYIAHRLVTEHGGSIVAAPRPGGGSVFTLTLPAAPAVRDVGAR